MIPKLSPSIRILLVVLSGASVWAVGYLLGDLLGTVSIGLVGGIFGFLVLVPFIDSKTWWYGRVAGLVVGSILIYAFVVQLAIASYGSLDSDIAVILSGVIGALLVGLLTKLLAPLRVSVKFWLYALLAGVFGGVCFSLLYESSEVLVAAGYLAWQLPVFIALYLGIR